MQWNTNLFNENDNYGIYGIKNDNQFIYIGTYKHSWDTEKEIIENYITHPEGTSIKVFHKMTPEERLKSDVISLFSTDSMRALGTKEEVLYYNTLTWIKQSLIALYTPKYNIDIISFNEAYIPSSRLDYIDSSGEIQVARWLNHHNIPFSREYQYNDLKGDYANLRFDFKIQDKPVVIEFQGKQHYRDVECFPDSATTRKYDLLKREYCGEKGIMLIEIPYNYKNLDMYLNQIMYIPSDSIN